MEPFYGLWDLRRMEVKLKQIQWIKYEVELNETEQVVGCFREIRTRLFDQRDQLLSDSTHREPISLDEIKAVIAKLPA